MSAGTMMVANGLVATVASAYCHFGIAPGECVAVAFSGGADSVALLASTLAAGYRAVALHCNFHLRGAESDRDEEFARRVASRLGCEIRVVHFDVDARRAATGESVEMACRWLRYDWFERQYKDADGGWACVAIAHHADDNVETFFLNVLRGAGLHGLCAIPPRRGIYVRPLLGVARDEILAYLRAEKLDYVVDSTNLADDYKRNFLRNKALPLLQLKFPALKASVAGTVSNLRRDNALLESLVKEVATQCIDGDGCIDLRAVAARPCAATLLFHLLNDVASNGSYGFAMAEAMLKGVGKSGLIFHADAGKHGYLLDRGVLMPLPTAQLEPIGRAKVGVMHYGDDAIALSEAMLDGSSPMPRLPIDVVMALLPRCEFCPSRNASVLWLDAVELFKAMGKGEALVLRHWRNGDRIAPFGMKGSRLVSDVFSDAKLSLADKHNMWLLACGNRILWLPGLRTSRHFAVGGDTEQVLKISLKTPIYAVKRH